MSPAHGPDRAEGVSAITVDVTVRPVLDVGGSHVTAALVAPAPALGGRPTVRDRVTRSLDSAAPATDLLDAIAGCARELPPACSAPSRWAAAVPGPFDYATGIAWYSGVAKFDALRGVDVGAALQVRLADRVSQWLFLSDAEAFAVGEWAFGAAAGVGRVLALTVGTGIGSSFLRDGAAVIAGPQVPPAGRVDLLTVNGLPLEESVSSRAIRRRYSPTGDAPPVSVIADRARNGEPRAGRVLADVFTDLGAVLAPWVRDFGAEIVVVGGGVSRSWDLLAGALRSSLGEVRLVAAEHREDAALLGAAHRLDGAV